MLRTQVNNLAGLAKWLYIHLGTKWLWVRVPLQSDSLLLYVNIFLPPKKFIMEMTTAVYNTVFHVQITLIVNLIDSLFLRIL